MADPRPSGHEGDPEPLPPELHLIPRDTSFEHPLDETAPKPEPVHDGDGMEIPRLGGERKPIVAPSTCGRWPGSARPSGSTSTRPGSTPRSTRMRLAASTWPARPGGPSWASSCLARAQLRWWWVSESAPLRSKAVVDGNAPEWRSRCHGKTVKTRSSARRGARRRAVRRRARARAHRRARAMVKAWHRRGLPSPCRRSPTTGARTIGRSCSLP